VLGSSNLNDLRRERDEAHRPRSLVERSRSDEDPEVFTLLHNRGLGQYVFWRALFETDFQVGGWVRNLARCDGLHAIAARPQLHGEFQGVVGRRRDDAS
jgi:hypothetical protein